MLVVGCALVVGCVLVVACVLVVGCALVAGAVVDGCTLVVVVGVARGPDPCLVDT